MAAVRLFQGDVAGARKIYSELTRSDDKRLEVEGFKGMAAAAVLEGRFKAAFEQLEHAMQAATGLTDRSQQARVAAYRAFLSAEGFRDGDDAGVWIERARAANADDWAAEFYAIRAAIAIGDPAAAPTPKYKAVAAAFQLFAEADRLTRAGRHSETASLFELARANSDMPGGFLDLQVAAYLAASDLKQAVVAADRIHGFTYQRSPEYPLLWVFIHPRALLLGAKAHELASEKAKAERDLRTLLELWKNADTELVDLKAANEMRARLATATHRR